MGAWGEPITITIVNEGILLHPESDTKCFGILIVKSKPYRILIAVKYTYKMCGVDEVLDTLFHEWGHYLQFKEGKKFSESGASRRASSMLKKFKEENP